MGPKNAVVSPIYTSMDVSENPTYSVGKYPLERRWTVWFDVVDKKTKQNQDMWGTSLRAVYAFDSVDDFWCLFNNMAPVGSLPDGVDLYCFVDGIEPKWEDPMCMRGGEWRYQADRKNNGDAQFVNMIWLFAVLACIGEQFNQGENICGIAVNLRKSSAKFFLWTKNASNEALQMSLGRQFRQVLELPQNIKLSYFSHDDLIRFGKQSREKYLI